MKEKERHPHRESKVYQVFHMSSGWFDCTEPSPTTFLQGIQGVQGAICTGSGRFKVYRLLSHEFGVVRLYRTFSNDFSSGDTRCAGCPLHRFGEVQAHRTSSNFLDVHPHRASMVSRFLSHEFGVVRLYRTFSNDISSGNTRCTGCKMHCFGEVQAHRTSSNPL